MAIELTHVRAAQIPLDTYGEYKDFAGIASESKLLGGMSAPDALLVLARGREIGLAPAAALTSVHIIKGKPTLSARAKYAACLARKDLCSYFLEAACTDESCTYETLRVGDPRPQSETFTIADAQRAGLSSNDNYKRFPKAMLRARAQAALADRVYPDVILGLATTEDMEAEVERDRAPAGYVQPQYAAPVAIRPQLEPAPAAFDAPAFDTAGYLARFAAATSEAEVEAIALDLANADTDDTANAVLLPAYEAAQLRVSCLSESDWAAHLAAKDVTFEVANSLFKRAAAFEAAGVLDARTALAESRLEALGVPDPGAFLNAMYSKRAA